jgi:ribosomal protein S18 acetylase RimI-like enzyme
MEIRFLSLDDAPEWLRLRLEALEGDPQAFSASLEEYRSLSIDAVKQRLWSSEDAFVVGALDQNRLLGMAGFFREKGQKTRHKGHVWGVYVTPEARGNKLARRMMEKLLERGLAIEGVTQILISVSTTQQAAVALYRSLGFQPWGCEPRALKVEGTFIDEEYMVLTKEHHRGGR